MHMLVCTRIARAKFDKVYCLLSMLNNNVIRIVFHSLYADNLLIA